MSCVLNNMNNTSVDKSSMEEFLKVKAKLEDQAEHMFIQHII